LQDVVWRHEKYFAFVYAQEFADLGSKCLGEGTHQLLCFHREWNLLGVYPQVVVCIIADGRKKVHQRVLDCLTLLGVYQAGGHMQNRVNEKEVTAHVFEYTTSFALDPNLHFKFPDKGIVPCQIIFCMKEKNQKKINSHRWGFNAFGAMLQVCASMIFDSKKTNSRLKDSRIYVCCWMWARDQGIIASISSGRRLI